MKMSNQSMSSLVLSNLSLRKSLLNQLSDSKHFQILQKYIQSNIKIYTFLGNQLIKHINKTNERSVMNLKQNLTILSNIQFQYQECQKKQKYNIFNQIQKQSHHNQQSQSQYKFKNNSVFFGIQQIKTNNNNEIDQTMIKQQQYIDALFVKKSYQLPINSYEKQKKEQQNQIIQFIQKQLKLIIDRQGSSLQKTKVIYWYKQWCLKVKKNNNIKDDKILKQWMTTNIKKYYKQMQNSQKYYSNLR